MGSIVNSNPITLTNLGRGDVIARFDQAMAEVLANIVDKRTNLKKRKITIICEIEPDVDRETADLKIEVKSTFCPISPYKSAIIIGRGIAGEVEAHECIEVPELRNEDDGYENDSENESAETEETVNEAESAPTDNQDTDVNSIEENEEDIDNL